MHPADGERRGRVALLAGCAQQVLAPSINEATIRLLTRLGIEVVVAPGAGCCGALTHHMGRHDPAMAAARANIAAWTRGGGWRRAGRDPDQHLRLRHHGEGLRLHVPRRAGGGGGGAGVGAGADISEFLARIGYAPTREAPGLTVAYHAACSLQHGQGVSAQPKALLRQAGFTVVEPAEGHLCCGSAGTYNMLQPEIAGQLRERKLGNIRTTRPDLIAAGNIGCLTQLAGGGLPTVHTVELLDWMAGGPRPAALEAVAAGAAA